MKITIAILCGILVGVLLAGQINQVVSPLFAETNSPVITQYDPTGQKVSWEKVESNPFFLKYDLYRSWIPSGWLVFVDRGVPISIAFYPDPEHKWQPAVREGAPWGK